MEVRCLLPPGTSTGRSPSSGADPEGGAHTLMCPRAPTDTRLTLIRFPKDRKRHLSRVPRSILWGTQWTCRRSQGGEMPATSPHAIGHTYQASPINMPIYCCHVWWRARATKPPCAYMALVVMPIYSWLAVSSHTGLDTALLSSIKGRNLQGIIGLHLQGL